MALSARRVHLLALMDPFVFAKLRIERPLLQPTELEGKSRSQFLQARLGLFLLAVLTSIVTVFSTALVGGHQRFIALLENISVMSHKDVITLVVKGGHLPATELCVVRKQAAQEPPGAMSQPGGETVEDQLRHVG